MSAMSYKIGFLIIQIITTISEQSSTTTSYLNSNDFWSNFRTPRSKYYYYFAPRSYINESPLQLASSRGDYDHYEGYQAKWATHVPQPIYIHHTAPYHKEKSDYFSYLLPLLLLALLPFVLGALVLLPLLLLFFTNILQLIALLQQTVQNTTTTAATNVGRRRRDIDGVNPLLTTTVMSLVENFSSALDKYGDKSLNF